MMAGKPGKTITHTCLGCGGTWQASQHCTSAFCPDCRRGRHRNTTSMSQEVRRVELEQQLIMAVEREGVVLAERNRRAAIRELARIYPQSVFARIARGNREQDFTPAPSGPLFCGPGTVGRVEELAERVLQGRDLWGENS